MRTIKIKVITKTKNYPIIIGPKIINKVQKICILNKIFFEKCLIVYDKKIPKKNLIILKKNLKSKQTIVYPFNASEKNKTMKNINYILEKLFKHKFNRNDCIISFGGGITGDVSGFAASIFKRGTKFVNIPTTLLAQVDSSIGGKTGVNNSFGKNLIGTFMQPDLVISDTNILYSLPKREVYCGYAEILKHSLIHKKQTFNYLNKNLTKIINLRSPFIEKAIAESCKIKKNIVEKDEKEKNLRKILNLGHTFAHAYEATLAYSSKLNHGEAVILGLISASKFSFKNKFLKKKEYVKISNHLETLKSKINLNNKIKKKQIKKIIKYMKSDKKNYSSKINLILIKKIGKIILNKSYSENALKKFFLAELTN